jgi:G:T-mismatch repair DNA endonuclease (very short patch repair protein)
MTAPTLKGLIRKYGEVDGNIRWQKYLRNYEMKKRCIKNGIYKQKSVYTEQDILNGDAVRCLECGMIKASLQHIHFKKHEDGLSKTIDEYKQRHPDTETIAINVRKRATPTLEGLIKKYGEVEGRQRWEEYRNKQAYSNSFEYKQKTYGWDKKQFDKFNKSRSVTLDHLITKHGKDKGQKIWNRYLERQRYTTSKDYFITEYGEELGNERWDYWNNSRLNNGTIISKIETEMFDLLENHIGIYTRQYRITHDNKLYVYDYGDSSKKKLIEFFGDFWHCNPNKYDEDYYHPIIKLTAIDIRLRNEQRINIANKLGYNVKVIWESDFRNNKELVINELVEWWNS